MKPKDAANSKNTIRVYNALYGDYKVLYPFFKFEIGDKVRISKKKRTFEKGYTPNWSEELFVVDKQLDTSPVTYILKDLKGENIEGSFMSLNYRRVVNKCLDLKKFLNETLLRN